MSNFESTLARIKELSKYGLNETEQKCDRSIEHHLLGADGKEYGIIREGTKFYIKTAPKGKGTLSEAYDYIGGILNKKNYQYSSYSDALKNFDLKMRSLNEAYNGTVSTESLDPYKKNIVLAEATDEMKNQIARMRQIMHNAAMIMNESSPFGCTPITNQPEAAKGNSGDTDTPFTDEVKCKENCETPKATEPEKQSTPFDDKAKVNESVEDDETPSDDVADATKDLDGGEDDDMEITDEPVELGDDSDEDEPEDLGSDSDDDAEDAGSDDEEPSDEDEELSDDDFEPADDETEDDDEDLAAKVADLEAQLADLKAQLNGDEDDEFSSDDVDDEDEGGYEFNVDDDSDDDDNEFALDEGKLSRVIENAVNKVLKENELHVFGQHPGYRKKPMTLPPTGSDSDEHGRDWNDESVHSERPFGEKIGKSTPFDHLAKKVTSEMFEQLRNGKKKVK